MTEPDYKTKLVENIDDKIWRRFTGYCVANNVKVGHKLSEILDEFLANQ